MHCAQKMTHNIYWIGSNDWTTERFENLFPIPNGVSSVSYTHLDVYKRQNISLPLKRFYINLQILPF